MDGLRIDRNRCDTIQAYLNAKFASFSFDAHGKTNEREYVRFCVLNYHQPHQPPPRTRFHVHWHSRDRDEAFCWWCVRHARQEMCTKYQYVKICSTKCGQDNIRDGFGFSLHNINVCVWEHAALYIARWVENNTNEMPFSCCYRRRRTPRCCHSVFGIYLFFSALICIGMPSNRQITSLFGTHVPVTWKAKTHIEGRAHTEQQTTTTTTSTSNETLEHL